MNQNSFINFISKVCWWCWLIFTYWLFSLNFIHFFNLMVKTFYLISLTFYLIIITFLSHNNDFYIIIYDDVFTCVSMFPAALILNTLCNGILSDILVFSLQYYYLTDTIYLGFRLPVISFGTRYSSLNDLGLLAYCTFLKR